MANHKNRKSPQLKPHHFKKGKSGNPGGRPRITPDEASAKAEMFSALWTIALSPHGAYKKNFKNPTCGQKAAMKLYERGAIDGNLPALQTFMDRIMGKIPLPITGKDGAPIMGRGTDNDPLVKLPPAVLEKLLTAVEKKPK